MKKEKVMVKSEFAPLKKVVLTQSEFIFPQNTIGNDLAEVLSEEVLQMYKDVDGKNYKDAFPDRQAKWEKEREDLKAVLEKYGVEVIRPRLLTDYEKESGKEYGCSNFFVRDPFFTIGNNIIEGSLRYHHRRKEILPIRGILENIAYSSDAMYVSLPMIDTSEGINSELGPFLEGGDILVLDKTVFVGNSGQASNDNGYKWLKSLLGHFDYKVVQVPLKNNVLHLDCALSLVRDGLMIVCEEALINGIPEDLKNWDKILVPFSDVSRLAVNGFPVNDSVYILDPEFEYIGKQLISKGITVEYIDFGISRSLGGSFRCSTQPLLRY
ncbi:amidinotransferase family protein [[Clostridium] sordellii]|uniref:dimethylarginine dimethylaminohydrolase family protein n=1 Tax=Paraclostridium sordellii TaxID=1505 RepID=UPI0005E46684|nr:arginine deiminase family protein [Paeniclostridium sordellii]MDU2687424.1 arginine deiminase family protein [Paeniclostridium sordellii]MVO72181.1 amidinotransferase [Paeniclostridium sordellii]CEN89991.1 amidinotransferase family protein [[Clostridium] sordellii] [Paeniclostridium sordellii]CEO28161.1 amidinotransferase family protein [[Clostridium] sordellii] [Paeniclostridium sordellii]CEP48087.1 amidinotransferase family protein [[Clostridium] sordellii] [Paeniclostridium sordellii]